MEYVTELSTQTTKSLVQAETQRGEARYRLLETVRQYSLSLLDSGEADNVRRRHRDWYLAFAEQSMAELIGARSEVWLERLEIDHDNLRAAMDWSKVEKDGAEAGLRLAGALWWFLFRQGHWSQAQEWLEGALTRRADAPPAALPRALAGASHLAARRGDHELAMTIGTEGLALSRELGDTEATAVLLMQLGTAWRRRGDAERATAVYDECLKVSRELGNKYMSGHALSGLGLVAEWLRGDRERAMALHTEGLAEIRQSGDKWGIALILHAVGTTARDSYDYGRAAAAFTEGLRICRELPDRWLRGQILGGLATLASATGHHDRAARLFGIAEALHELLSYQLPRNEQAFHDRYVACTRAGLGDVAFDTARAEGRAMTAGEAIEYALAIEVN